MALLVSVFVILNMQAGRMLSVLDSLSFVSMRQMGVMARCFMIALLSVLRSVTVMLCCLFEMVGSFQMKLVQGNFGHDVLRL
jgi:hypothetical protein